MPKKNQKPISFDAVLKSFVKSYNLPTKKDIEKLMDQLDRLEKLLSKTNVAIATSGKATNGRVKGKAAGKAGMTASDIVLNVISGNKKGADFKTIQNQTGFDEKKIRNIIFRLNKIGKITRQNRGIYVVNNS